jgi:hypothetical protein
MVLLPLLLPGDQSLRQFFTKKQTDHAVFNLDPLIASAVRTDLLNARFF